MPNPSPSRPSLPMVRPRLSSQVAAYGIEAAIVDQIEGGTVVVEGEPGVIVEVPAADADDARRILSEDPEFGNPRTES